MMNDERLSPTVSDTPPAGVQAETQAGTINQDHAIINETLEAIKKALTAVKEAPEMRQNHFGLWLKCKEALDYLTDEEPRLQAELAKVISLQADSRALATLRAAAGVVIEQTDRDAAIGLGRSQFANLDLYEVVLTSEQVKALRVALTEDGGE